jgi:hypothetical protein
MSVEILEIFSTPCGRDTTAESECECLSHVSVYHSVPKLLSLMSQHIFIQPFQDALYGDHEGCISTKLNRSKNSDTALAKLTQIRRKG